MTTQQIYKYVIATHMPGAKAGLAWEKSAESFLKAKELIRMGEEIEYKLIATTDPREHGMFPYEVPHE